MVEMYFDPPSPPKYAPSFLDGSFCSITQPFQAAQVARNLDGGNVYHSLYEAMNPFRGKKIQMQSLPIESLVPILEKLQEQSLWSKLLFRLSRSRAEWITVSSYEALVVYHALAVYAFLQWGGVLNTVNLRTGQSPYRLPESLLLFFTTRYRDDWFEDWRSFVKILESDHDYFTQQHLAREVFGSVRAIQAFMYSFGLGFTYAHTVRQRGTYEVQHSLPRLLLETLYGGELRFDGRGSSTLAISFQESGRQWCIRNDSILGEWWSSWKNTIAVATCGEVQTPVFFRSIQESTRGKYPTRMIIVQSSTEGGTFCIARVDLIQQLATFTYSDPVRRVTRSLVIGSVDPKVRKAPAC